MRLLGKPAPPCKPAIRPVPQLVTACDGTTVQRDGQTTSSAALTFQTSRFGNYTYTPNTTSGVPESIRIQQVVQTTLDLSTQTPVQNADGSTSFLVNPATRFKEYEPYQPPACPLPLPASATNAGNPAVRQPPCVAPNIILV